MDIIKQCFLLVDRNGDGSLTTADFDYVNHHTVRPDAAPCFVFATGLPDCTESTPARDA